MARRPGDHQLLGIDVVEEPEGAADIMRDGAHALGRNAEAGRDGVLDPHRALAAGQEGVEALRLVVGADGGARLHVGRCDALIAEGLRHHEMRAGERRLDGRLIAERGVECEIAGDLVVQQRRSGSERRERRR